MKSMLSTLALVLLVLGVADSAASAQYYRCGPYGFDGPPCPRVRVHPRPVPYFDEYNYTTRGFEDHNPAIRGNRRGCSVDLGYGRYESCDK